MALAFGFRRSSKRCGLTHVGIELYLNTLVTDANAKVMHKRAIATGDVNATTRHLKPFIVECLNVA